MPVPLESVLPLLQEAAQTCILPRFRALTDAQVQTKSGPHDLVTIADQESEILLSRALCALLPGSLAVGEEAVSRDPSLLDRLRGPAPVWLIDPVDGTWNFAHGDERFCVMVALSVADRLEGAWILEPLRSRAFAAVRGQGTWHYDLSPDAAPPRRIHVPAPPADLARWRGSAYHHRIDMDAAVPRPQRQGSAGIEYLHILTGEGEFALYSRAMPWDHAPGSLLLSEAGARHAFADGTDYHPSGGPQRTVAAAASPEAWHQLLDALLPDPALR